MEPKAFLIAATNLDSALDVAVKRRFDEVLWSDKPDRSMLARFVAVKFKNVATAFKADGYLKHLRGRSYADIERICVQAMRNAIVDRRDVVAATDFTSAIEDDVRRNRAGTKTKCE